MREHISKQPAIGKRNTVRIVLNTKDNILSIRWNTRWDTRRHGDASMCNGHVCICRNLRMKMLETGNSTLGIPPANTSANIASISTDHTSPHPTPSVLPYSVCTHYPPTPVLSLHGEPQRNTMPCKHVSVKVRVCVGAAVSSTTMLRRLFCVVACPCLLNEISKSPKRAIERTGPCCFGFLRAPSSSQSKPRRCTRQKNPGADWGLQGGSADTETPPNIGVTGTPFGPQVAPGHQPAALLDARRPEEPHSQCALRLADLLTST